jgi:hypothetical protein
MATGGGNIFERPAGVPSGRILLRGCLTARDPVLREKRMTDLSRRTIIKGTGAIGAAMLPAALQAKTARAEDREPGGTGEGNIGKRRGVARAAVDHLPLQPSSKPPSRASLDHRALSA